MRNKRRRIPLLSVKALALRSKTSVQMSISGMDTDGYGDTCGMAKMSAVNHCTETLKMDSVQDRLKADSFKSPPPARLRLCLISLQP